MTDLTLWIENAVIDTNKGPVAQSPNNLSCI